VNITVIAADANCDSWADGPHRPSAARSTGGPRALVRLTAPGTPWVLARCLDRKVSSPWRQSRMFVRA